MYNLMVVDDEPKIRNGICNYFPWNEIGFNIVAEAKNGRQALDYILQNQVDIILCDIKMPVMSGIELAEELYSRKNKVKIVFLSGYKDFEFAQKAMMYGVKYYIIKPTKYNELLEVFSRLKEELDLEQTIFLNTDKDEPLEENEEVQGFHQKRITSIKAYVNEHYQHVTLDEVSSLFHMNFYYLSKYFKKWTGQNFSEYVISVKMEQAAILLKDIHYKTYEISTSVGYDNAKNFSRTFKKHFGISPREYRDSIS